MQCNFPNCVLQGANAEFEFYISSASSSSSSAESLPFELSRQGTLVVANGATLDREATQQYQFKVTIVIIKIKWIMSFRFEFKVTIFAPTFVQFKVTIVFNNIKWIITIKFEFKVTIINPTFVTK